MNQSMWADSASEPKSTETATTKHVPSTLSAAAATFAPEPETSAPPPDGSSADMYAPTGAMQSDLFDDFAPVESMRIRSDDDLFSDDFTPAPQPVVERAKPQPQASRGSGEGVRGRARGRGRGGDRSRGERDDGQSEIVQRDNKPQAQPQATAPDNAPTGPRKETVPSVRGERHGTGGLRKPKLTEEELAEKMAQIQIKNASLTAAHARAEADAASFAQREQQAKQVSEQRKKEERRDRQQMMGERERNRQRKLKAMEGREWDAEKQEDDFRKGGKFDKKGGFAGDQPEYSDGRQYLLREARGGGERGRGGRGGRAYVPAAVPKGEDFPALPGASKAEQDDGKSAEAVTDTTKPSGKSWADQVEAS